MGTVPIGTGELRRIHSRVAWMSSPVERSITVSAPQRVAQRSLSTSSRMEEVTAELPMLALILVKNALPMIIGSLSGWLTLFGMMARPAATSARTFSTSQCSRNATNSISRVISPRRAYAICVTRLPSLARSGLRDSPRHSSLALPRLTAERPSSSRLRSRPVYSSTSPRAVIHSPRRLGRPTSGSAYGPRVR